MTYLSVVKIVDDAVSKLLTKYPTAQIIVTGHSLGGALGMVSGIELQLKYNKVAEVYVFGAPRIGNVDLAHFINIKIPTTFRVIHNKDIVPHLPF